MVRSIVFVFLFVAFLHTVYAQVPSEIEFGGMELKLSESVRRKLQADIDMITRSPKAFQTKVDRADLYFPIIEKIFKEENVPDDFKFLSLQESSLISDAVSSSNAVGYWQFKKETAIEVGLRVDYQVDERMNIISSSRGAAKYLKKNNTIYFNNWIYALLAYNTGAGGAKSLIKEKYIGANKMVIDGDMHWYVIRFLAHKLAYEGAVGKTYNHPMVLVTYDNCRKKSLKDISGETQVDIAELEMYNKWLLKGRVPDDKDYYVILPVKASDKDKLLVFENKDKVEEPRIDIQKEENILPFKIERKSKRKNNYNLSGTGDVAMLTSINGVRAIKAKDGDNSSRLALQGEVEHKDFLRFNDLKNFEQLVPGRVYFLQRKKNKALVSFHTVQYGESIKDISQKYAMNMDAIRSKNRMKKNETPQPGRVLWLRRKRSVNMPVEIKKINPPIVKPSVVEPVIKVIQDTQRVVLPKEVIEPQENAKDTVYGGFEYHNVKQGETLYGISRMHAVSLDSLRGWNGLLSNDLKLGQTLVVKKNAEVVNLEKNSTIEHVVLPGETLYQISKRYEVSIEGIQKWNNKTDTNVSVGEILLIKK